MILAWVVSIVASLYLGYHYQRLQSTVHNIGEVILAMKQKRKVEIESEEKTVILDPDNLSQMVELDEKIRKLNE